MLANAILQAWGFFSCNYQKIMLHYKWLRVETI